ncbi:LisH protein [Besnoitia besnoiti]|uniref:LisH protein n=1 Tax=Besnoitia besnoiti TaxID=94643 RepID=A0A2A9LX21_BESBE|nr:LisH protein [Besnoitia besnoiti]PFH31038.1 LisH protein [Besnoitia besnoiti]
MATLSTSRGVTSSGSPTGSGAGGSAGGAGGAGSAGPSPSSSVPLVGFMENFSFLRPFISGENGDSDDQAPSNGAGCTPREWMERMGEVEVYERDLHRLILNFFTVNGFGEAAAEFAEETGLQPDMPLASIARRSQIREAVLEGRMEEAIRLIHLVDPQILAANPEVNFLLKQQQLLSLIERGDTCAAIDFAQLELAPCVRQHADLLPKLEEAMALLAFSDLKCEEAQRLLGGMDQRQQTARRIDEAILDFFNLEQESALENLAKNALWSQKQVRKRKPLSCPSLVDLATGSMAHGESGEGSEIDDPPLPLPLCTHPSFSSQSSRDRGSGGGSVFVSRRHLLLRSRSSGLASADYPEGRGGGEAMHLASTPAAGSGSHGSRGSGGHEGAGGAGGSGGGAQDSTPGAGPGGSSEGAGGAAQATALSGAGHSPGTAAEPSDVGGRAGGWQEAPVRGILGFAAASRRRGRR